LSKRRRRGSERLRRGFQTDEAAWPHCAEELTCATPPPRQLLVERGRSQAQGPRLRQRRASRSQRPRTRVTREAVKRGRSVTAALGCGTQRGSRRTMRRAQLFHATSAGARTKRTPLAEFRPFNSPNRASHFRGFVGSFCRTATSSVGPR